MTNNPLSYRLLIIIPAFNEASVLATVISAVKKFQPESDILVVDDGSSDNTAQVARDSGVIVLSHILNRGLGGAIGTGLIYARDHDYNLVVTLDADGQHDPQDIKQVIEPILENRADIVIGSRLHADKFAMPIDRRIINRLANLVTLMLFKVKTTDSQSGFRALNQRAIQYLNIRTDRMEVSSEIFTEIKRLKLRYQEVPIKVIYTTYSKSKGQANMNMWRVGYKLMLRLFR